VSSISPNSRRLVCALLVSIGLLALLCLAGADAGGATQNTTLPHGKNDPREAFERGQTALQQGHLEEAEAAFRNVLALDPGSIGAYSNLGVVYMREKQWKAALSMLQKADKMSPGVPGIRLNIGLTYYRQNKFQEAIPAFESVVRNSPASTQARYLLGLCYFFTQNYSAAAAALEPLQQQELNDLNYLYVLAISAWKSKQPELEQRSMARLLEVGGDSPEFHLLMGKAHLNREEYDNAIKELQLAAHASPRLPFVHFYLGLTAMKKQDFDTAEAEFLKDAEIEPDVPYNYDQLGLIEADRQHLKPAEQYFAHALRIDPNLGSARYQLARVYQSEGEYTKALIQADTTAKLQPGNASVHYLRGQILQHLKRTDEAKAEMQKAAEISNQARTKRQQELESPDPDLRQQTEP